MLNKIYKFFFYFIIILVLTLILLITFNSNLRKNFLNNIVNAYKVFIIVSLQSELKTVDPKYSRINDKLISYLNVSKKISSGNSRILIGIYDAAKLVDSSIVNMNDYGYLEKFYQNILKIDPEIYEAKVWYAKSLYANNKIDDSILQISEAIKISELDPEPYRLAMLIATKNKDIKTFNKFCRAYLNAEFGGKLKRYQYTKFNGFNLNKFAVKLNPIENNEEINTYIVDGINQDNLDNYEIVPKKTISIKSINLIFTFIPGTILEIDSISFFSKNKTTKLNEEDLIINSKNAFFNNSKSPKQIIFTDYNNEILDISSKNDLLDIDKVIFKLKFNKMSISNYNCNEKNF